MKPEAKLLLLIFYILLVGILLFLSLFIFQASVEKDLRIIFFDVSQGDSSLIITPDQKYILVDGGPDNKVIYKLGKYLPFFGREIDLMVLTHPHDDHLVGLLETAKRYNVKMILMPKTFCQTQTCLEFEKIIDQKNIPIQFVDHSGLMNISPGLDFEILMPSEFLKDEKNLNNHSIVFQLVFKDVKALFMGDQENEEELIEKNFDIDLVKIGHHGSYNANDCDFLKTIDPIYAIVSVGKDNQFNHPSQSTLDCLEKINAEILRTDQLGDLEFLVENGKLYKKQFTP